MFLLLLAKSAICIISSVQHVKQEHTDVCLSAFPVQRTNIFLPQRSRSLTQCLSKQTLFITTQHSCNSDFIYITFFQWVKLHI